MKKVVVTSVSAGGSGGEDRLRENVTFNYAEIQWKYVPQDQNGNPGTEITKGWNVELGEAK